MVFREVHRLGGDAFRERFCLVEVDVSMLFGSIALADGRIARVDRRAPAMVIAGHADFMKNGWTSGLEEVALSPGVTDNKVQGRGLTSSGSLNHWMLDASSNVPSGPTPSSFSLVLWNFSYKVLALHKVFNAPR